MVKLEIIERNPTRAKFVVEDVHPYFVNALRRILVAEVPKLAVDEVTFYDNSSALTDEMIAHRLALIPLPTPKEAINLTGRVDEEGNPMFVVRYRLTKVGEGKGFTKVLSGDLECDDASFLPTDKNIPIAELMAGQTVILEAKAILGTGTTHAKFQPCQAVGYRYFPTAVFDEKKLKGELAEKLVSGIPVGILEVKGGKLQILDHERLSLTEGHRNMKDIGPDLYHVEYNDRKFIFTFETDGSLNADDAMFRAIEILRVRLKEFQTLSAEL